MKIRSKTTMLYLYGSRRQCLITITPKQKWDIAGIRIDSVIIQRKGIHLEISIDDYERYFEGVR